MIHERQLVEALKDKLESKFERIWIHKKPSSSERFRLMVQNEFGQIPILQPEFDMVFKTFDGKLNAIEAKQLNKTVKGYNMPFYRGIDQAIALQRFGFDHVGLWLFVNDDNIDGDLNRYGASAWHFIRNEIKLNIEYTYFKILNFDDKIRFCTMQYRDEFDGFDLLDIDDPKFIITWKFENPIKGDLRASRMRRLVENYLNEMT